VFDSKFFAIKFFFRWSIDNRFTKYAAVILGAGNSKLFSIAFNLLLLLVGPFLFPVLGRVFLEKRSVSMYRNQSNQAYNYPLKTEPPSHRSPARATSLSWSSFSKTRNSWKKINSHYPCLSLNTSVYLVYLKAKFTYLWAKSFIGTDLQFFLYRCAYLDLLGGKVSYVIWFCKSAFGSGKGNVDRDKKDLRRGKRGVQKSDTSRNDDEWQGLPAARWSL